jgi:predicted dienelactone hydrolase
MKIVSIMLAGMLVLGAGQAEAVGFQRVQVPDPHDLPIEVGIWYPSDATVPAEANTPFRQSLALDGPAAGSKLPLVLISHGSGGWIGGHADLALALAEAGFVVAAPAHTGNHSEDERYPPARWMVERPRHVGLVLDYMLGAWSGHDRIDPGAIGIFGFSAGAYTAMVAVGAVPDLQRIVAHCASHPDEHACGIGSLPPPDTAEADLAWRHDPRIRAAVAAAVGFGFAFDEAALAKVNVPVQLWAAADDRVVPYRTNMAPLRRSLPTAPEFHLVENAGHFAFLRPCDPRLESGAPDIWTMVCIDAPGFDRRAFHRRLDAEVAAFFGRTLRSSAPRP